MNNNQVNQESPTHRESLSELLGQLAGNLSAVVHDEIELLTRGIREKAKAVRSGILLVGTGAVILFAAFLFLCATLIIGLTYYMAPVIAALVTGAALGLIGVIMALIGYKKLKNLKT